MNIMNPLPTDPTSTEEKRRNYIAYQYKMFAECSNEELEAKRSSVYKPRDTEYHFWRIEAYNRVCRERGLRVHLTSDLEMSDARAAEIYNRKKPSFLLLDWQRFFWNNRDRGINIPSNAPEPDPKMVEFYTEHCM